MATKIFFVGETPIGAVYKVWDVSHSVHFIGYEVQYDPTYEFWKVNQRAGYGMSYPCFAQYIRDYEARTGAAVI